MKNLSSTLTEENGKTRKITAYVDNQTAELLNNCTERIRHEYIIEEYKAGLINRKETRRHQSLEQSIENGYDIAARSEFPIDYIERRETQNELYNALDRLTDKQRFVLIQYAIENLSFREIGNLLGISKEAARLHYLAAIKKMKKFLE